MAFSKDNTYVVGGFASFVFGTSIGGTWDGPTSIGTTYEVGDIAFDGSSNLVVIGALGVNGIYHSGDNGTSFAADVLLDPDVLLKSVSFGAGVFFAVGADFLTGDGRIFTSPGDGNWTNQHANPFIPGAHQATVNATYFNVFNSTLMVGGTKADNTGGISLSTDHVNWSAFKPNSFTNDGTSFASINDFASNGVDTIIAGGHRGAGGVSVAHAQRSVDGGNTWTDLVLNSFGSGGAGSKIDTMTFGNGIFIAAGNDNTNKNHLERSTDNGVTWVPVDLGAILPNSGNVNDVKWSSALKKFVLATRDGTNGAVVALSPTGLAGTWVVQTLAYPGGGAAESAGAIAVGERSRLPANRIAMGLG